MKFSNTGLHSTRATHMDINVGSWFESSLLEDNNFVDAFKTGPSVEPPPLNTSLGALLPTPLWRLTLTPV
jgi:hypothetical protein